jgi:hypothetical protein
MAVDSIIASPTNNVRVIVAEASGCWASELRASATALPSLNAGPIVPKPVVIPAVIIDAIAIIVMLSIHISFCYSLALMLYLGFRLKPGFSLRLGLTDPRGRRNVNRCQNAENIGLHHTRKKTEHSHDDRKNKWCNSQ